MAANNLVNTKAELISALVQKELKESASLLNCCEDYSSLATKGYSQVSIPKYSSFTVQDRAFGAAVSENSPLSSDKDTIDLDKNKIILFGYDANDDFQNSTDYLATAIQRASAAHGRQINDDIITEWEAVADLSVNGGTPADITADNILEMREKLISNFADMSRVKFVIAADQERVLLGLPEFSRYDYRGGVSPILNGLVGFVYGIPVQINQQLKAQQAFMVDPMGCGFAFQRDPSVGQDTDLRYGSAGQQVAVDCLYGVSGLQIAEGDAAAGKTSLVAKLTD